MDPQRFDDLLRVVSASIPRRGLLAGLSSGLLAMLPFARAEDAAGKKKKGKRKKKTRKNKNQCVPQCAGKSCGDNGCGGSCGACGPDQICQQGTCICACSGGSHCLSNGSCAAECTDLGDCASGCGCALGGLANTEGELNCVSPDANCGGERCQSTAECPAGTQCMPCVAGEPTFCVPLCAG